MRATSCIALRAFVYSGVYRRRGACADAAHRRASLNVSILRKPVLGFTLRQEGLSANRKRVQRLMRVMGIESMAPKPSTSMPYPEHAKYPYLLRGLHICRANQVWATDITYIPMRAGFVYLVCVMDWFSRRVLSWRLSTTMDTEFCVEALEEAILRFGRAKRRNMHPVSLRTSSPRSAWRRCLSVARRRCLRRWECRSLAAP